MRFYYCSVSGDRNKQYSSLKEVKPSGSNDKMKAEPRWLFLLHKKQKVLFLPFLVLLLWNSAFISGKNKPSTFLSYTFAVLVNVHRITPMPPVFFPTWPTRLPALILRTEKVFCFVFLNYVYRTPIWNFTSTRHKNFIMILA